MECQSQFSGKNKKNIINLSSAELDQRVVKVKHVWVHENNRSDYSPCHAERIKMPRPLLISSQSNYLIQVFDRNSHF